VPAVHQPRRLLPGSCTAVCVASELVTWAAAGAAQDVITPDGENDEDDKKVVQVIEQMSSAFSQEQRAGNYVSIVSRRLCRCVYVLWLCRDDGCRHADTSLAGLVSGHAGRRPRQRCACARSARTSTHARHTPLSVDATDEATFWMTEVRVIVRERSLPSACARRRTSPVMIP
jgi:hypothetical protein